MKILSTWRQLTPYLIFNCCVFLSGALMFGIDTGSFGSLQALPSFLDRFGILNDKGNHVLPPTRKALMNSLPWIGKIVGCFIVERLIELAGYKKSMYAVGLVQIVGIIVELTAKNWVQFTVGRIIAYLAVGLVENVVPAYNAEISPAAARGLLSGSIMLLTGLGNLWGAGMSRAYATDSSQKGWIIPTAMQLVPAVTFLVLLPFTVESPRWLILKGRKQAAKKALDKIRSRHDVDNGATAAEVDTIELMIEESRATERASWPDIFRGNYLRRTWICATLFVIQQSNGNQFVQSYAPTFYVQQGLGSMSFTYAIVGQALSVVGCICGLILFDIIGRRPLFIFGSAVACFLLYLASGLGSIHNPNQSESNTLIACFMIVPAFTKISGSNCAYITGAEIGGLRMRKKIMAFATAVDVLASFLVTFVTPYLLPGMGSSIGWIFGSVACFAVVWGALFFPELKGRSLEEVDELFAAKLKAWQFSKYQSHGAGRFLATIENDGVVPEGVDGQHVEILRADTKEVTAQHAHCERI
ncbi:hypothetical protein, variant [Cladophialophora immunda]|uniref:Major facilitator superfamily (MFS) profile domain-containing protein n=1 Tax=Cladophialophora immunda TaxID=569365 RepID=A0A0D1ZZH8_9EURO|nr:hypothetical protein, variant [Cladophialophora immunda]KIW33511.1 hypothetical protein, variant [Cladophialophora immunda]